MAFFKNTSSDATTFRVFVDVEGRNVERAFPAKPGEVIEVPDAHARLVPFLAPLLTQVSEEQATAPVVAEKSKKA